MLFTISIAIGWFYLQYNYHYPEGLPWLGQRSRIEIEWQRTLQCSQVWCSHCELKGLAKVLIWRDIVPFEKRMEHCERCCKKSIAGLLPRGIVIDYHKSKFSS